MSSSTISDPSRKVLRRFLRQFFIGFLLGMAVYLVEAGIAELFIAQNAHCIEEAGRIRFGPAPRLICYSEYVVILLNTFSHGLGSLFVSDTSPLTGFILASLIYGVLGGLAAQLPRRWGVVIFVIGNLLLVFVVSSIRYLSGFIR